MIISRQYANKLIAKQLVKSTGKVYDQSTDITYNAVTRLDLKKDYGRTDHYFVGYGDVRNQDSRSN